MSRWWEAVRGCEPEDLDAQHRVARPLSFTCHPTLFASVALRTVPITRSSIRNGEIQELGDWGRETAKILAPVSGDFTTTSTRQICPIANQAEKQFSVCFLGAQQ